jgi:hypothetical protein
VGGADFVSESTVSCEIRGLRPCDRTGRRPE